MNDWGMPNEGSTQKRHNEYMAVEHRKIELHEQDIELWKKDIELREGDHKLNVSRDWREKRLFGIAFVSIAVSVAAFVLSLLSFLYFCAPR